MSIDRRQPPSERTDRTYRNVQRFDAGVFGLLGLRITVRGAEHLPATAGAVHEQAVGVREPAVRAAVAGDAAALDRAALARINQSVD